MAPQSPVTIPVAFLLGLLSGLKARGKTYDDLLTEAGIPLALLEHAGARITAQQYAQVFRGAIEHFGDEGLGFFSRPLKPGTFALLTRSALGARTLEKAIQRMAHVFWLLQDDVVLELHREADSACLVFRFSNPQVAEQTFLHALLLRVFWRLLAWLAGGRMPATRFDFPFACSPYTGNYSNAFPADILFDQPQTAFWFDATWLQRPVRREETALRHFLADAQANIILPRRSDDIASARVRSYLQICQPVWPDLATTAESLHVSIATLQRKLAQEGTSFQTLKDDLRRDTAIVRLNTSAVSLAELARELGFTDSAAFQRAFKSWTGAAPGTYRRGK